MIKRNEYRAWYRKLNLSNEQKQMLGEMLENMMTRIAGRQNLNDFWAGRENGLNSAWRMIDGELQNHDEFDD